MSTKSTLSPSDTCPWDPRLLPRAAKSTPAAPPFHFSVRRTLRLAKRRRLHRPRLRSMRLRAVQRTTTIINTHTALPLPGTAMANGAIGLVCVLRRTEVGLALWDTTGTPCRRLVSCPRETISLWFLIYISILAGFWIFMFLFWLFEGAWHLRTEQG